MFFTWFRNGKHGKGKLSARKVARAELAKKLAFRPLMEQLESRYAPDASVLQFATIPHPPPGDRIPGSGPADQIAPENIGTLTVTVNRAIPAGDHSTVTVNYATSDETAKAGTNYTAASGTLTFGDGVTSQTFTVSITNVPALTGNTVFGLALSNATGNAVISDAGGVAAITLQDASNTQTERYVNDVYLETLKRGADPGGLAFWSGLINSGFSKEQFVTSLLNSSEGRTATINNVYQTLYGRNGDPGGLSFWSGQLATQTLQYVRQQFIGQNEYLIDNNITNNVQYVNAVYRETMNRNADNVGEAFFLSAGELNDPAGTGLAGQSSRTMVAGQIINSTEAAGDLATNYYAIYLNRTPDSQGLAFYVGELSANPPVNQLIVVAQFIGGTNEYYNQEFVPGAP